MDDRAGRDRVAGAECVHEFEDEGTHILSADPPSVCQAFLGDLQRGEFDVG